MSKIQLRPAGNLIQVGLKGNWPRLQLRLGIGRLGACPNHLSLSIEVNLGRRKATNRNVEY